MFAQMKLYEEISTLSLQNMNHVVGIYKRGKERRHFYESSELDKAESLISL